MICIITRTDAEIIRTNEDKIILSASIRFKASQTASD